jgi:hypothetical protein
VYPDVYNGCDTEVCLAAEFFAGLVYKERNGVSIRQIEISFQETGPPEDSMECLKVGTASGHHSMEIRERHDTHLQNESV